MPDTLSSVLERVGPDHAEALLWFARHQGETGPRPWGRHRPSDAPAGVKLVAQRGIHVPDGFRMALSVNSKLKSRYGDGKPLALADGTWLLPYSEHGGGDGAGLGSEWNRGLHECWRQRVPVGVTYEVTTGRYRNMGLAFVEDYDPRAGFFLLHGPVQPDQDDASWFSDATDSIRASGLLAEESPPAPDIRKGLSWTTRRDDQGQFRSALLEAYDNRCAVTSYDVCESLQAAHILNYSGRLSQIPQNGLLLRADLHLLFDQHLLSVNPDTMRVTLAPPIRASRYSRLHDREVVVPRVRSLRPSAERLGIHFEVCQIAWSQ